MRLPYSHGSFERLGRAVRTLHSVARDDAVEDQVIETLQVAEEAW